VKQKQLLSTSRFQNHNEASPFLPSSKANTSESLPDGSGREKHKSNCALFFFPFFLFGFEVFKGCSMKHLGKLSRTKL